MDKMLGRAQLLLADRAVEDKKIGNGIVHHLSQLKDRFYFHLLLLFNVSVSGIQLLRKNIAASNQTI